MKDSYHFWQQRALQLLTRREHSVSELSYKLRLKGCPDALIQPVIDHCLNNNLLNQNRFAIMLARNKAEKGYGRNIVKKWLQQHKIDEELITTTLSDIDWSVAGTVALRKTLSNDLLKTKNKLYQRGFNQEEIAQILGEKHEF